MSAPAYWRAIVALSLAAALGVPAAAAQTSTGTIAGSLENALGAAVAGATITIVNVDTGRTQQVTSEANGHFASPWLAPGKYLVRARSGSLVAPVTEVLIKSNLTTVIRMVLIPDGGDETVSVSSTLAHDEPHQVSGWIDRASIEMQPANGRNALEIAKVEPGVANPSRTLGRVFVAALGAGLQTIPRVGFTRMTLDGGNIETPGTIGTLMQISPDSVEQLHVATANFDIATGLATGGAIDLVSRSGGNTLRGGAFSIFRGRDWSAPPGPGANAGDPPFRRLQSGMTMGGPIRRPRTFFFVGAERHDEDDAIAVQPRDADLRPLGGVFTSPLGASLFNARVDAGAGDRHRAFARYTLDTNRLIGQADSTVSLPSGWTSRRIRAAQLLAGITTTIGAHAVNNLHVSELTARSSTEPIAAADCPDICFGFSAYRIVVGDAGLTMGRAPTAASTGRRFQISETLAWLHGAHLWRMGVDLESTRHSIFSADSDPARIVLWSPDEVRQRNPSLALPASVQTFQDVLALPVKSFTTSIGSGDVLQRGFGSERRFATFRMHVGDEWRVTPGLSVAAGVAWSYEPHVLNDDLRKPEWLLPLVGNRSLGTPSAFANVAGTVSMAWQATADGRTIVHAGAGRYVESMSRTVALNLASERVLLSPIGTGRLVVSGANLTWDGVRLQFSSPTAFTGADLVAILPEIRATLQRLRQPENRDFSIINLDATKEGRNLIDPSYTTPTAWHASAGIDRKIGSRLTLGLNAVWKRFSNTFVNGIDYNRFGSAAGPVIPACIGAQRTDLFAPCSNGNIYFDTTSGRARYGGVLVRARHTGDRSQVLVSYALGSFVGSNGTATGTTETADGRVSGFNNDDWRDNYGPLPTDLRHVLNISGHVALPGHIDIAFNVAAAGRSPFSAYVAGMDFNGDGTINDLLPGTRVNQFNRGLDRDDLVRLVADYNATVAGRPTPTGAIAPALNLPGAFRFNDTFFAADVRVTRTFLGRARTPVIVFADIFNVLNTANDIGFSGNLADAAAFGQPRARIGQSFGSGGPRAAQVGIRVRF